MSSALIVFAKEPVNGNVKTRLRDCLPERDRTRLYKAFVEDTLILARKVKDAKKILAFASDRNPRYLKSVATGFEMVKQKGRTLGDRMYNAFIYAHESKSRKTVIIGTDSPTLPSALVEKAFKALSRMDIVIGPSIDGGYYLIGMKEPCAHIFKGVRWSSASVLKQTLNKARSLGMTTELLKEWFDVDDYASLRRLKRELTEGKNLNIARNTRAVLDP